VGRRQRWRGARAGELARSRNFQETCRVPPAHIHFEPGIELKAEMRPKKSRPNRAAGRPNVKALLIENR
jgi:hypothetical protein